MQDSQVGTVIADSEDDSNDIEDDFYCSSGYVSNGRQKSVPDEDLGLRRLLTEEEKKHGGQNTGSNVIKYQRKGKGKLVNSSKIRGIFG